MSVLILSKRISCKFRKNCFAWHSFLHYQNRFGVLKKSFHRV